MEYMLIFFFLLFSCCVQGSALFLRMQEIYVGCAVGVERFPAKDEIIPMKGRRRLRSRK